MRRGPVRRRGSRVEMMRQTLPELAGTEATRGCGLIPSDKNPPMTSGCMTCTVTFGSGVRIGTGTTTLT